MTIYTLYVKTHRKTGLKYLGQTKKNPIIYLGSGIDWVTHLAFFGNHIDTETLIQTSDWEELKYWGRYYSLLFRVTTSVDDFGNRIWANRIPETGGGGLCGDEHPMKDDIVKQKHKKACKKAGNVPEVKQKRIEQLRKCHSDLETSRKMRENWKEAMSDPTTRQNFKDSCKAAHNTPDRKGKRMGRGNSAYDHTIYQFVHKDGTFIECTRHDLQIMFNLRQVNLSQLINGHKKSHMGWSLAKREQVREC
jgi:hypothetical protein